MKKTAKTKDKSNILLVLIKYLVLIFTNYFRRVILLIKKKDYDNASIYLKPWIYTKFKWKYYPRYYDVERKETSISHILLDNDYPESRFAVELFNLDPSKIVFFIDANMSKQPIVNYKNPVAILLDISNSDKLPKNKIVLMTSGISDDIYSYGVYLDVPTIARIDTCDIRLNKRGIFKYIDSTFYLTRKLEYSGQRLLPKRLYDFMLKQDVIDKNDPIWSSYILSNLDSRQSIKDNSKYYLNIIDVSYESKRIYPKSPDDVEGGNFDWAKATREEKEGVIRPVINKNKLFDTIADGHPSFKSAWNIEKARDKFAKDNNLEFWFEETFEYLIYSNDSDCYYTSKYIDGKLYKKYTVNNSYVQLFNYLDNLYKNFLPIFINGTDYILHDSDYTKNRNFYDILYFLDNLKDNEIIGFVNFNSPKLIEEQVNSKSTKLIIKLATVDTKNKEVNFLIDQTKITDKVLGLINKKLKEDIDILYIGYFYKIKLTNIISEFLFTYLCFLIFKKYNENFL